MSIILNRRRFGALLGAGALAGATLPLRRARAAETIYVLNWQGYGTDEAWALKAFTEKTGIEVKHDYFNSEEEMVTKLRTNPGAYDVVLVNSARIPQVQAEDLIEPLDLAAVPNAAGLAPTLRDHANIDHRRQALWRRLGVGHQRPGLRATRSKARQLLRPCRSGLRPAAWRCLTTPSPRSASARC